MFGVNGGETQFDNEKKRPDLVVLNDWSIGVTGAEGYCSETDLMETRHLLIIELKRGGSTLTRDNVTQATNYIHDFLGCKELTGNPIIKAYVVGEMIADNITTSSKLGENDRAHLIVATYGHLVNTAKRRLFRLRETLNERYEGVPGIELAKRSEKRPLF